MLKKVFTDISLLFLIIILFSLSQPNLISVQGIPILAYFIYLPLFILVSRVSWKTVWLYGFLCGVGCYCLFTYWLATFHPMGISVISSLYGFQFMLLFPLLKGAPILLKKRGWILQWLVLCAYEYIKTTGFAGFHYGLTAYTHWRWTVLIQITDIGGVWLLNALITFPSAWLSSFFAPAFKDAVPKFKNINFLSFIKKSFIPISIWTCFFVCSVIYGVVVQKDFSNYETKKTALIQTNTDPWIGGYEAYKRDLNTLMKLSNDAIAENPDIDFIVWPETAFVPRIEWHYKHRYNKDSYDLVRKLLEYINNASVPYVIGSDYGVDGYTRSGTYDVVDYNAVLLFKPSENVLPPAPDKYLKMHLVPFTEFFPYEKYFPKIYEMLLNGDTHMWEPGTSPEIFTIDDFSFGTPICFEDTFGYIGRRFINNGAQAIVNLSNDAWSKSISCQYQHLSMAIFRSVENRVSSVRATASGQTCIIDPNGKITAMAEPFTETYLVGTFPINSNSKKTIYTRYGDFVGVFFVYAAGLVYTAAVILQIIQAFKKKRDKVGYIWPEIYSKRQKNVTVLGSETQFIGIMQFKDELVITGKFDGTIEAEGHLEVDKKAQCSVDSAHAHSIIISGQVTGNLRAQDRVEMKSGSRIIGNIAAGKIRIEDNVDFQGKVSMLDTMTENDLFSMNTADYKESLLSNQNT